MRPIFCSITCVLMLVLLGADGPATAPAKPLVVDLGNGISMEFIQIPAGSFTMGSTRGEDDEKPVHKVTISKAFYIGKYEVTQEQWQAVMGENPSSFKSPKNPVDNVSWDDCQEFLQKLAQKIPGKSFALPTEAQWEYACRAGTTTEYSFGNDPAALADHAWYLPNAQSKTHPVGQKKPNAWGLYDMHGNACEWCADWYTATPYTADETTDPTGPTTGEARVLRGESWVSTPELLRSAYRVGTPSYYRNSHVGLRLVSIPPN